MGRGRAPCCAKVGLNKGSWTVEEDMKLISYIQKHGHGNWRALPKLAGLLRCGKSCRLRWINYLRPDIKRGNFTKEEEDTIIKLHELLGNKWSKIASCLPGRTDNEIKNVWNTHLKKRLASKVQKPAVTGNLEEALSSSFSCTCSDQGERKSDEEQIINPSLDCHNSLAEAMLQANNAEDQNISTQHLEQQHAMTPSSFSSTELFQMNHIGTDDIEQEEAKKDDLVIPDILIDPEIWSMIADDDDDGCPFSPVVPNLEGLHQWNSIALEDEPDKEGNCREWLECLDAWSRSWN